MIDRRQFVAATAGAIATSAVAPALGAENRGGRIIIDALGAKAGGEVLYAFP